MNISMQSTPPAPPSLAARPVGEARENPAVPDNDGDADDGAAASPPPAAPPSGMGTRIDRMV